MPHAHRLDTDLKIFYQTIYGHCTFSDLFQVSFKPELNPANRPRVKFIIDNILGDLETDEEGVKVFVKAMLDLKKTGFALEPTAFLTTKTGLNIFMNALELLVDDDEPLHQAFSSLDEALRWLDETNHTQEIRQIRDELLEELKKQKSVG